MCPKQQHLHWFYIFLMCIPKHHYYKWNPGCYSHCPFQLQYTYAQRGEEGLFHHRGSLGPLAANTHRSTSCQTGRSMTSMQESIFQAPMIPTMLSKGGEGWHREVSLPVAYTPNMHTPYSAQDSPNAPYTENICPSVTTRVPPLYCQPGLSQLT